MVQEEAHQQHQYGVGEEQSGSTFDWRPCVAGVAAGAMASAIGHPLDTVRVRMQIDPARYPTAMVSPRTHER